MSKITRPNADVVAFASQSQSGERTIFGSTTASDDLTDNINTDFIRGWEAGLDPVTGYPPQEWFAAQAFTISQLVSYCFQHGIPEWNTNQFYPKNAFAMSASGVIWQSLQDQSGHAQVEGSYWTNPFLDTAIGIDQEWESVLGSRSDGVTYYNTSDKPIEMILEGWGTSGAGTVTIGGILIATLNGEGSAEELYHLSVIIPAGSSYVVDFGSQTITRWMELRE